MSAIPPLEPQIPGAAPVPLQYARPMPKRSDLRQIAIRQKAIQFCILGYFVCGILMYALPQPAKAIAGLA